MALKWVGVFVLFVSIKIADADLHIQVFSVSSKSIIFKWDKIPSAVSYHISLTRTDTGEDAGTTTFGPNTVMGSISVGLTPDTQYTYALSATNPAGNTIGQGNTGTHFTAPNRLDNTVTVTPKDSTSVEVAFTPHASVSKYVIRVLDPADNTFIRHYDVTSSPAVISDLQPYTEYEFSVMSANNGGRSQPTRPVKAKTLLAPPQIQSASSSESTIELTWSAVPDAVEYTVSLLKFNANVNETVTQNTSGTSYTFTGLDPGALYVVQGYGRDAEDREGEHSAAANQTTRPPAPVLETVTMIKTSSLLSLSVSWSMDPGVFGEIRYNVSSDQGQVCSNTSSMSCELTPVTCGTVHSVTVIAENDAGPSSPSVPVSFTTVPCPPQDLSMSETSPGSCNFTWSTVPHADGYRAYVKNIDGVEKTCNVTGTSCDFTCECGYTYLMSVFAHNAAGLSQEGPVLNYTTIPCCPTQMNVSLVAADTLEIEWVPARGAELYETRASDSSGVILCNDTAPVCALSYLSCDTPYSVKVIPCNDVSGCNHNCSALTKDTAACTPTAVSVTGVDSSRVTVSWASTNRAATFLVTAKGENGVLNCSTADSSCNVTGVSCGCSYEVGVTATSPAGESLPSYTVLYETEPCCPSSLSVKQVTMAMTNVSWSAARGAHTFLTSLNSTKGHASCHTEDTHCIMGCITCGTNYTVAMEAYSLSGLKSDCSYEGFSSSLCCPSGVRIYRIDLNKLRVSWRATPGALHSTTVDMRGFRNFNCTAAPGENYCDINNIQCGDQYTVLVLPVKYDGTTEDFCPHRKYGVSCAGPHVGAVLYRGKRSVE